MFGGFFESIGLSSPSKAKEANRDDVQEAETGTPGSTEAGSSPDSGPPSGAQQAEYSNNASSGLPEYDYPAPVFVKNTFIDSPSDVPASLVEFMPPREAQSCPGSAFGGPPGFGSEVAEKGVTHEKMEAALNRAKAEAEAKQALAAAKAEASAPASKIDDPTPLGSAAVHQPTLWPRTMSGEGLGELVAAAAAAETESSPCRPTNWPRTMSGDQLADLAAAADAVTPERGLIAQSPGMGATPSPQPVRPMAWPRTMSGDQLELSLHIQEGDASGYTQAIIPPVAPPSQWAPVYQETTLPPPPSAAAEDPYNMSMQAAAPVLRLSEVIPEPILGSPDMPTMGSRGHRMGNCKPCAFLHTKGCNNGLQCVFCHLCEPGEKKKRQREKRQLQRMGLVQPQR